MHFTHHILGVAGVALGLAAAAPDAHAAPLTEHPRLWVTNADLPRLRGWAADSRNRMYREGLRPALQRAIDAYNTRFFPSGQPNPTWPDQGYSGYVQYPTEAYAELFAFMSLIDPIVTERVNHARRARSLLMYAIDEAAKGRLSGAPFRGASFAVGDRSRWWGEGFPLTVDWIYDAADASGQPILSAGDKARIRQVFLSWASDNLNAAVTGDDRPQPIGVMDDPALLRDKRKLRWAANNYYLGHLRQVTLMSLSMDEEDDPPLDPRRPAEALGNTLRSYIRNATGAWLYQAYAVLEEAGTAARALGVSEEGLGVGSGGLPVEGFLYGVNLGNLHEALLALHTAGYHDEALSGPQIGLLDSGYWDGFTDGFLHSIAPAPVVYPSLSYLGPVYEAANYGDTQRLWVESRFGEAFASLGVYDYLTGNVERLQKSRWIVANALEGGASQLYYRTARIWGSPAPSRAILSFMLFEPDQPLPADPRPALPTEFISEAEGRGRVLARTDWTPEATWFNFGCGFLTIDHQLGDCNRFELYRKGEWLTKEHSSYSGNLIGFTTDYHNTLSIKNDVPSGLSWFEVEISARGSQWMQGGSAGDPTVHISRGPGYVFGEGISTPLYNTRLNPWVPADNAQDIAHASRSILWLKPDHVVVYDRATSFTADRSKRFNLTFVGAPRLSGRGASLTTPRGQQLSIQVLLPENASLSVLPVEDVAVKATMEPTTHRLVVEDPTRPADVRFLHVLQGADAGGALDAASRIESDGADFEGAVVGSWAVLFRSDLDASPPEGLSYTAPLGARTHVVTGLVPGAGYDAALSMQDAAVRVSLGPGTALTADDAGVLVLDFE